MKISEIWGKRDMKKLLYFAFFSIFAFFCTVKAENVSIDWMIDDNVYTSTTCNMGGDLILPQTPSKPGYVFRGWRIGYVPVEYLEFPAAASVYDYFIDTGFVDTYNTTFRIKLNMTAATGGIIFGHFDDNNHYNMYRLFNYNQTIYFDITNISGGRVNGGQFRNNTTYDFMGGIKYIKDYNTNTVLVGSPRTDSNYHPVSSLKVYNNVAGKIYLLQIWDNDILVRDMIPALDYNNTPCMFDRVENKFYYNTGSTTLVAGPIVE